MAAAIFGSIVMMMSFDSLVQFYPKLIEAARRDSSRAVMGWVVSAALSTA